MFDQNGFTMIAELWVGLCNIHYVIRIFRWPCQACSFLDKEMLIIKHGIRYGLDPHDDHDDFQAWPLITSGGVGVLCVSIVWQFVSHLTMMSISLDGSMFCV